MPIKGNQTETGKAFEYACATAIHSMLNEPSITNDRPYTNIINARESSICYFEDSPQAHTAQKCFYSLSSEQQKNYRLGASAAIKILKRLEPQLTNGKGPLRIVLQPDSEGIEGDVRDVLCIRNDQWEIGLSCKHNHEAVKHSRLSDIIDFGQKWFNRPCSDNYFAAVKRVFVPLRTQRDYYRDLGQPIPTWASIQDKDESVYKPVLNAFTSELKRLDSNYPNEIPAKLIRYLVGRNDFYKVIMDEGRRYTKIESININGTLNQPAGKNKSIIDVPILKMPTKFYEIDYKDGSKNTVIVVCDNGWNISMRIHNASSRIEPSLKFDVQLLAMPQFILTQIEPWDYD